MADFANRPSAAPTLLVGIGPVGGRLVRFLGERLANTFLARTGMLTVVDDADPEAVRRGIDRMTNQRAVLAAEVEGNMRAPFDRYLRLQLVAVGNLAEMEGAEANPMVEIADRFLKHPHPPEGLRLGFVLDASRPGEVADVAEGLRPFLARLEELAEDHAARRPGLSATAILAHRALLDGTHLDHPNLDNSEALEPDLFERELARLLEAMLRPGEEKAWQFEADRALRYLFVGGGSAVFPRELLLGSTGKLHGADLLERTRLPLDDHPLPPEPLLPSRATLLERTLAKLRNPAVTLERRSRAASEPTLFDRIFDGVPAITAAEGIGLKTAASLGDLNGASPAELAARYEEGAESISRQFEADLIPDLNRAGPEVTAEILASLREDLDAMIGGELGGVDRALRSLEAAQAAILVSLTPDERKLLAEVDPRTKESGPGGAITPRYLERTTEEFPEPTPDLLARFQKAVSRLPGYPAVLLRGGMVGAVLSPIFAAHPQGWLISLGSFGLGVALFSWAWFLHRNKVERMRLELLQRLEDSLGRQAYKRGHDMLGVSREGGEEGLIRLGVLPQLWRYLEDWEKPLVRGFEGVQSSGVALMRRADEWPDGFLLGVDWLDVEDPWLLHGDTKYKPEDATATARELLREEKIFQAWRCPSFPTIEGAVASTGRRDQLVDFEEKPMGDFFQELSRLYDRHEGDRHHAERVVKRLELLALRCLPLARSVAEKDVVASDRALRISVPESLDWLDNAKRVQGSSGASPDGIPSASGFQRRISWLFADQATQVDEREADHATALGLFPAPDAATAAEWLGVPAEAVAE